MENCLKIIKKIFNKIVCFSYLFCVFFFFVVWDLFFCNFCSQLYCFFSKNVVVLKRTGVALKRAVFSPEKGCLCSSDGLAAQVKT